VLEDMHFLMSRAEGSGEGACLEDDTGGGDRGIIDHVLGGRLERRGDAVAGPPVIAWGVKLIKTLAALSSSRDRARSSSSCCCWYVRKETVEGILL
jgi:hypothetical protein